MHSTVANITKRIEERSRDTRTAYLQSMQAQQGFGQRLTLGPTNLAHAYASSEKRQREILRNRQTRPNLAIITAYNDILSAHAPYADYPDIIKAAAIDCNASAQVASGTPAMCDGVTQGQAGMELSLFSRDVIALATAVGLTHQLFDGTFCLGICDKIVPGLLIGALKFGFLPTLFIPGGPMPSGISNEEKSQARKRFQKGEIDADELLISENKAYHSPGTCTFYGTANTNQLLLECMGLQLPGSSFVNPGDELRRALTIAAVDQMTVLINQGEDYCPLYKVVTEKSLVNAIVGLLASGGSSNHSIHLIAVARSAGIIINWDDFHELSKAVPTLMKVYPNGSEDVNAFQAAGATPALIRELLSAELMHEDVTTIAGPGLSRYTQAPSMINGKLVWQDSVTTDKQIIADISQPFADDGGLIRITGECGRGIVKTSALPDKQFQLTAPVMIFDDQTTLLQAFKAGELDRDFFAFIRWQGPCANGMPELHQLTPCLSVLQDRGHCVAIITDGRMSGASGRVPAVLHLTPETGDNPVLARLRDGDMLHLDLAAATLDIAENSDTIMQREPAAIQKAALTAGRELFASFRNHSSDAEHGASTIV